MQRVRYETVIALLEMLERRRLLAATLRIDSASSSPYTDSQGVTWDADRGYSGGNLATNVFDVAGTTDDSLYYLRRYGPSFSYSLAVPNGQYSLTLRFAETYAPNQRKFDVFAEGVQILNDYDIAATDGAKVAVQKTFAVNIADGKLNLQFTGVVGNATISAIALDSLSDPTSAPASPSNLLATGISTSQTKLTWQDNSSDETLFEIERKTGAGNFAQVAAVGSNVTSFTDSGLAAGTTYTYRVRASNGLDSDYSNEDSATTYAATQTLTWKTVASSPIVRAEALGGVVNGKLYVLGGFKSDSSGNILAQARCDVYNPAKNKWTRIADQPEPFTHGGTAIDGKTIWMVGGYVGNHPGPGTTHVWKYDTAANKWSRGPDLPEARGAGGAAIIDRQLHFFGGMDETRTSEEGTHWALDLDNPDLGWSELAPLPNPRNHTVGVSLGGFLYCIGGQHGQEENQVTQDDVHRYDPITDTWTQVASLPDPRSHIGASTFVMNNRILVIGGENAAGSIQRTVFAYDPDADAWSTIGLLPARSTSVCGVIGPNKIISSTGNAPNASTTTWIGTFA